MKKETLEKLINKYDGDDLAKYISNEIDIEQKVKGKRKINRRAIADEAVRHDKILNNLMSETNKTRALCPHYEYTFHPDASGGNDSSNVCDWCGLELD